MKTNLIIIAISLISGLLFAAEESPEVKAPKELDSLTTNKGKEYKNVKIREVTPAGIKIVHEAGAATIPFEDIPKNIQDSLGGFNADAARKHREQENQRLTAQERAMSQEIEQARQQQQAKKNDAFHDTVKMPTRIRIKQVNDDGALCEVSVKTLQKSERRIPRPLGGYDIKTEETWVWSGYSEEWYFVTGLPNHLVDDDTWEGWTLSSGSHPYVNTRGARKTVRKLNVVPEPKK